MARSWLTNCFAYFINCPRHILSWNWIRSNCRSPLSYLECHGHCCSLQFWNNCVNSLWDCECWSDDNGTDYDLNKSSAITCLCWRSLHCWPTNWSWFCYLGYQHQQTDCFPNHGSSRRPIHSFSRLWNCWVSTIWHCERGNFSLSFSIDLDLPDFYDSHTDN